MSLKVNQLAGFGVGIGSKIYFVGRASDTTANSGDAVVDLTALSGGVFGDGNVIAEGDYVVVFGCAGSNGALTIGCSTSGFSAIDDLLSEDGSSATYYVSGRPFAKVMTSSPDSSVTITSDGGGSEGTVAVAMVFRGVSASAPLGGIAVQAASGNGNLINPPSVTPTARNSWTVHFGGSCGFDGATVGTYSHATLKDTLSVSIDEFYKTIAAISYYDEWSGGAFDAAAYSYTQNNSINAWVGFSLVLKPA